MPGYGVAMECLEALMKLSILTLALLAAAGSAVAMDAPGATEAEGAGLPLQTIALAGSAVSATVAVGRDAAPAGEQEGCVDHIVGSPLSVAQIAVLSAYDAVLVPICDSALSLDDARLAALAGNGSLTDFLSSVALASADVVAMTSAEGAAFVFVRAARTPAPQH